MSASTAKGTSAETAYRDLFRRELGAPVDRQPKRGNDDTGDLDGFPDVARPGGPLERTGIIMGVKNHARYQLAPAMDNLNSAKLHWLTQNRDLGYTGVLAWELFTRKAGAGRPRLPLERGYAVCEVGQLIHVIKLLTGPRA